MNIAVLIIAAFVLNMRNARKGLTLCLAFLFVVYLERSYPGEVFLPERLRMIISLCRAMSWLLVV